MERKEALEIALHMADGELLASAKRLREEHFGNFIHLCGIVNAKSGHCAMDCKFCSQRCGSGAAIESYPFLSEDILRERVCAICARAQRCSVVTSGGYLAEADVKQLIGVMGSLPPAIVGRLCGSLGRLPAEQLAALRSAGLRRFCHNLETSERFYAHICTTQRWRDRWETIRRAKELGYDICAGGLFGMGESWEDRIDLGLAVRELAVTCMPINFLYPHRGTPFEKRPLLPPAEALRTIAVLRHLLPTTSLRICGGRTNTLGARQYDVFDAGANALMVGDYLTTRGETLAKDLDELRRRGLVFYDGEC